MATRKASTAKTGTKKKSATKATPDNGAKKSTGRTRGPDKLEGLTDAKKRNIAKLIFRERSKSPATSWSDIQEMILDKYDWQLPGSMTGRRLLRDHGPDNAEEAIIQQTRTSDGTKKKKKASAKKAKKVEEDLEDQEEELDEEEMEEEYDEELEADEDEDDDDLDDDEDEDEDEEDEPAPAKRRKVAVKRGSGRKANPSK